VSGGAGKILRLEFTNGFNLNWIEFTASSATPPDAPALVSPANAATDVSIHADLTWSAATGADSYGAFLWKSADPKPSTPTATTTGLTYDPGALDASTDYSWLIQATNSFGSSNSVTWTFTTEAPPPPHSNTLINVDFQGNTGWVQTGPGVIGLAGDIWNTSRTEGNTFTDLENLQDATGTVTTVDVTWTDELNSYENAGVIEFGAALNPLMEDYSYAGPGQTATITISQIPAIREYTLYLLGVSDSGGQNSIFAVTGANEGAQTVTSPDTTGGPTLVNPDDYVVFTGNTGAGGEIVYTLNGGGGFCGHNGFQLEIGDPPPEGTLFIFK